MSKDRHEQHRRRSVEHMTDPTLIVVTGAAGGIGTAACARLKAFGPIIALDRRWSSTSPEGPGECHTLDLATPYAEHQVAGLIGTRAVQHVVCIAGGALPREIDRLHPRELSTAVFVASLQDNLVSAYATVRGCFHGLARASGDRSITVISSVNAIHGFGMPGYSAAKAGLCGMVAALAPQLGPEGIRINALLPGTVDTARFRGEHGEDGLAAMLTLLGRVATPDDIADAIAALIALRHVTGQSIVVDGGQTLRTP